MSLQKTKTNKQSWCLIVATVFLVMVITITFLLHILRGSAPSRLAPSHALGDIGAIQVAHLLGNKGKIVIVAWDNKDFKSPALDIELSTLSKTVKEAGLTIVATDFVQPENPAMVELNTLPPAQFFDVVHRHSDANAIVFFMSLPNLSDSEIAQLPRRHPEFVILGVQPDQKLKRLFEHQVLQLAILLRPNPATSGSSKSLRECFDRYYQIVRTASEIP